MNTIHFTSDNWFHCSIYCLWSSNSADVGSTPSKKCWASLLL